MNGYVIALLVVVAYFVIVFALKKKGILEKYHLTQGMIFLMWRTERGKKFIDKMSKARRFWSVYAAIAKVLCIAVMIFMMALLIWEATLVKNIPAENAPGLEMVLGIPGLNPVIPIWYGIIGLVVAIVIHEFAHGILTRVGKMEVKSLGVIFLVIPMGAFVEPDEEAIKKTDRKKRTSIFAVGPGTNIIAALLCAFLFTSVMMSSVEAVREAPVVASVSSDSIADVAGLQFGAQIVSINGVNITNIYDWQNASAPDAGKTVTIGYYYKSDYHTVNVTSGVVITSVTKGYPAYDAGIQSGMIISSFNGTAIRNEYDLRTALHNTYGGETVNVTVMKYYSDTGTWENVSSVTSITLMSRAEYLRDSGVSVSSSFVDYGFMGVNSAYIGASVVNIDTLTDRLASPYAGMSSFSDFITDTLRFIALPFVGLSPVQSPISDLFVPTGIATALGSSAFWITANIIYWVFWINLMLGMTNVLPAVPLDGGYLFKDWLDGFIAKVKKNATEQERAKYVSVITYTLALFVLFLILWQIIGPRFNT